MWRNGCNDRACCALKKVFELPVIPLNPMVSTSVGVDKTRTDPNSIAGRAHATFQEVAHAEVPSIFP
jgi:hypothetical protein